MTLLRFGLVAVLAALGATHALAAERSAAEAAAACAGYGPGFQEVPGTRSCVRLGGRVSSEVQANSGKQGDRARVNAQGRLNLDARTETGQGPLRTFIQLRTGRERGN
jgi:hypothetical protein